MVKKQTPKAEEQPANELRKIEEYLLDSALVSHLLMIRHMYPQTWAALSPQTRKLALEHEKKVFSMYEETKIPGVNNPGNNESLIAEISVLNIRIGDIFACKSQDGGPTDE